MNIICCSLYRYQSETSIFEHICYDLLKCMGTVKTTSVQLSNLSVH